MGTLIYIGMLLAVALPAAGVILLLRRSRYPERWRYRMCAPKLLWPFLAIPGPMLLLAVMAAWTLQADRRTVEQDARNRAAELAATQLAAAEQALSIVLFEPKNGYAVTQGRDTFHVNGRFELTSPSRWAWPPTPAPVSEQDLKNLKPEKLAQWQEAESAFEKQEWARAAEGYLKLLENRPRLGSEPMADFHAGIRSGRFRSMALFKRAVALEQLGQKPQAIAAYNDLFDGFTFGRGSEPAESGLPLGLLAMRKILDLTEGKPGTLPAEWRQHPTWVVMTAAYLPATPLAEEIIRRLRANEEFLAPGAGDQAATPAQIFEAWERANRGRQYYAEASAAMAGSTNGWPDVFWVNGEKGWLAVHQIPPAEHAAAGPEGQLYAALPADWLRGKLADAWRQTGRSDDFDGATEFEDKARADATAPSISRRQGSDFAVLERSAKFPSVSVLVKLKSPERYFVNVRRRQILLGALVALAVAAGFGASWLLRRALLRQLSLNEQKSNFVSSVSHELRAPIASVRLMAESLERGNVTEPAKQREYFRFIGQECRRLSALIANVLDFARIEQGRKQYEFEPTDLGRLVSETVRLMQPYAEERGVKLAERQWYDCQGNGEKEPAPPGVHAPATHLPSDGARDEVRGTLELSVDGRAIQQALVNLIDNAVKHSPAGETVAVELETRARASSSNSQLATLHLSVADHGPGIPASEHERIFERFHRLGSELRRETQGVGIGLSIVKHIVEAHGGRVLVESTVGQGSRFTIELAGKKSTTNGHQ